MDASQMTRSGKIASAINSQKLKSPDGTLIPLLFFELKSEIDLGSEILEEKVNVLLQGEQLCEFFQSSTPKEGDEVLLLGAVAYVRNGVLCLRPTSPEQIRHFRQTSTAGQLETFGLSRDDFVKATTLFKK